MRRTEREHQDDLAYLRSRLSRPKPEIEEWLNEIVDSWVANRRAKPD